MLTQTQKDQLTQLMNDCPIPKLKKVLEEGLPRFISGEIEPIQHWSGITTNHNDVYYAETDRCCLLGAAVIGKKSKEDFSFDVDELATLTGSFDGRGYRLGYDKEIYDYVSKIRKVIFGC